MIDHMDQEVLDNLTAPMPKSDKVFQINETIQELLKPTGGDSPEPDDEDDQDPFQAAKYITRD